jgi:hypothetical protein
MGVLSRNETMNIDLPVVASGSNAIVGSASLDDSSPVQITNALPGVQAFTLEVLVARFGRPVIPSASLAGGAVQLFYPSTGATFVYSGKLNGVTWFSNTDTLIDQASSSWGNSIGLAVLGVGAAVLVGGIFLVKAIK